MTLYVDGLLSQIRIVVDRNLEDKPCDLLTLERFVKHARDEGENY